MAIYRFEQENMEPSTFVDAVVDHTPGDETETICIVINGQDHEYTVEQALALAKSIFEAVDYVGAFSTVG